jgi:hypothetical protein
MIQHTYATSSSSSSSATHPAHGGVVGPLGRPVRPHHVRRRVINTRRTAVHAQQVGVGGPRLRCIHHHTQRVIGRPVLPVVPLVPPVTLKMKSPQGCDSGGYGYGVGVGGGRGRGGTTTTPYRGRSRGTRKVTGSLRPLKTLLPVPPSPRGPPATTIAERSPDGGATRARSGPDGGGGDVEGTGSRGTWHTMGSSNVVRVTAPMGTEVPLSTGTAAWAMRYSITE